MSERNYRVGVFPFQGKKKMRFNAYTLWYNADWEGCCEHEVLAATGTEAKKKAIEEHKNNCLLESDDDS